MAIPAYDSVISFSFDDPPPAFAQFSLVPSADQLQHPTGEGLAALQAMNKLDELWFWKNVLEKPFFGQAIHSTKQDHGGSHSGKLKESVSLSFPRKDLDEEVLTPRLQMLNPREKLADQGGDEKRDSEEGNEVQEDVEIELKTVESSENSSLVQENRKLLAEAKERENELQVGTYSSKKEERNKLGSASKPPLWNNSGRQSLSDMRTGIPMSRRRRRIRRKRIKTRTELENDEVKGLKDLGFTFREDELTPSIVKLVPGLKPHKREASDATNISSEESIPRLYPPEDWWTRKTEPVIRNWQMPDPHRKGIDMKEQLKFWAHVVASNVRQ